MKQKVKLLQLILIISIYFYTYEYSYSQNIALTTFITPTCITGNSITLDTTGGSNGTDETTKFILTNNTGMILQVNNTPSFSNLNIGSYIAYAVSYETAQGVNQMSIGNNILSTTSNGCIDFSAPYGFNVCPTFSDCSYYLGDDVNLDTIGSNIPPNTTMHYVLTDSNGVIVDISSTPLFSNIQNTGRHFAYALAYENGSSISNFSSGNSITSVTVSGICYDWSAPYIFEVCFIENPTVTITKMGIDTNQAGQAIFYTFTINNNAGTVLNNVKFTDNLNNNFEFLSEPINETNGLQIVGSTIWQTNAQLTLNNVPEGISTFQLIVFVPINTIVTSFCNQASLSELTTNNPNLTNNATSNNFCTTIWKPEDCTDGIDNDLDGDIDCADSDCTLPAVTIQHVSN